MRKMAQFVKDIDDKRCRLNEMTRQQALQRRCMLETHKKNRDELLNQIQVEAEKRKLYVRQNAIEVWRDGTDNHREGIWRFMSYCNSVVGECKALEEREIACVVVKKK